MKRKIMGAAIALTVLAQAVPAWATHASIIIKPSMTFMEWMSLYFHLNI